ncbi:MAG TPA: hypothetical protein VKH81_08060 [Candidatus Angelobacter sp.]|nr:hypothetical protein [Candidatus Angelobacter sp.]
MKRRELFDQTDCTINPGEVIQHSGIYEICHEDESRARVILMRNTVFPYCRQCGERVRYKLLQVVPHISEDEDFREAPSGDNPGYVMQIPTSTLPMQLGRAHGFRFHQDNLQAWGDGPDSRDL